MLQVKDRKQVLLGPRKTRPIGVSLTEEAREMIDQIASENGLSRTAAIEMAIRRLYKELNQGTSERVKLLRKPNLRCLQALITGMRILFLMYI